MADFEPLLVTAADLAPPPGVADLIRGRAGQIRRRRRIAASAGSLVAVTMLMLHVAGVEGVSSLEPARTPWPRGGGSSPTVVAPPAIAAATHGAPAPVSEPSVRPAHARGSMPPIPRVGLDPVQPAPDDFKVWARSDPGLNRTPPEGLVCNTKGVWQAGPDGWCLAFADHTNDAYAPETGLAERWWLGVWLCRPPGSGPGQLNLATPPRLRLYDVADDHRGVFDSAVRWAGRAPMYDVAGNDGEVREANCANISVQWDISDNHRHRVPEGRYTYDLDLGDPAFGEWNTYHSGPVIDVTYGDIH